MAFGCDYIYDISVGKLFETINEIISITDFICMQITKSALDLSCISIITFFVIDLLYSTYILLYFRSKS